MNRLTIILISLFISVFANAQYKLVLDSSFANKGSIESKGNTDRLVAILISGDSLISVGDNSLAFGHEDFYMARYKKNGRLDSSFGQKGELDVSDPYTQIEAATLQPDRKIVFTGGIYNYLQPDRNIYVGRVLSDGSTDHNFGAGSGFALVNISYEDYTKAVAIDKDSKILISGNWNSANPNHHGFLFRFLSTGKPDNKFGSKGKLSYYYDHVNDVIGTSFQTDGEILMCASISSQDSQYIQINRFLNNGDRDSSYGSDGLIIASVSNSVMATDIIIQSNDKLLLLEHHVENNLIVSSVQRFTNTGAVDSSFGLNGISKINSDNKNLTAIKMLVKPNGKILIPFTTNATNSNLYDIGFIQLDSNGHKDLSFGPKGQQVSLTNLPNEILKYAVLRSDGEVITGGEIHDSLYTHRIIHAFKSIKQKNTLSDQTIPFNNRESVISIYPNPFNNYITISNSDKTTVKKIVVTDLKGKVWYSNKIESNIIQLQNLPSGLYNVQVYTTDNNVYSKTISKF